MDDVRSGLKVVATIVAGCLVAGLVVWVVWFSPEGVGRRELGRARDHWHAREPASYSFVVQSCNGMCAPCPTRVTVRDGVPVAAVVVGGHRGCRRPDVAGAATIDTMLEAAERARPTLLGRTSVSYDPYWGYPQSIDSSCPPGWSDCGSSTSVSDFEVLAD